MGEAGYSFSLTTFSPSGKLLQIEHALKAVQGGKTSLGIQGEPRGAAAARRVRFAVWRLRVIRACAHVRRSVPHVGTRRRTPARARAHPTSAPLPRSH